MKEKVKHIIHNLHPRRISTLTDTFLKDETIGGKLVLAAAVLSLIVVNSPLNEAYTSFWGTRLTLGIGGWNLSLDLRHWINEGLMALFFLTVGLEIKREFVKGELRDFKTAILPIGAAVGGMIIPAFIYLIFNAGTESVRGWGIPIATDIAFAVAVLSLLGRHIPLSLKVFLLTLAIADDIGAIIVIALFYAEIIHYGYLAASVGLVILLYSFRKQLIDRLALVAGFGVLLWLTTHLSGIHASIIGAFMGILAPIATKGHHSSVSERVERFFLPITTFIVLPMFAFVNAGFVLTGDAINNTPIFFGIFFGLVFGKVIGIVSVSWLMTKFNIAQMPEGVRWWHIIGVGFVAGIGFTVSIFIAELAFGGKADLVDTSKASIFIASGISAIFGLIILRLTRRHNVTVDS